MLYRIHFKHTFRFLFQVAAANMRSEITKALNDAIADEKSAKDIIADVKEIVVKTGIAEQDVVVLVMRLNVSKNKDGLSLFTFFFFMK